ncbi:MAG: transglycosylase domain-containing protein [Elusimicrobia bacterium]|nr:transglycosylase domain-containing protein [Elusimicrobiota bacterium]
MKNIRKFIVFSAIFAGLAALAGWLTLLSYCRELPSTSSLVQYRPNLVTKIFDINGDLIDELFMERRTLVPLNEIPVDLQNAVLAIEDTNFFNHWGIDIIGIIRAFVKNFTAGHVVQGGSTITQQLAKVMFLTPERNILRKLKELILAMHIEREFSKEEILQFYLNQIYFGEGAYGVETAAKTYFDKPVQELKLSECAMLAGLPRAPTAYSPENNIHLAYRRRAIVLRRMRELDFITEEEELLANADKLPIKTYEKKKKIAPYFVEDIRKELQPEFGANTLYKGGLRIYTTLDLKMQEIAQRHMHTSLDMFDEIKRRELEEEIRKEKKLPPDAEVELTTTAFQNVQGALISIDPRNGQVKAMVGGRDFEESEFNRATQAMRQPGSGFKPFIYTAAIDSGLTPATILHDEPRVYYNDGINWKLLENCTNLAQLNIDFSQIRDIKPEEMEGMDEKELEDIERLKKLREKVWSPQNYYKVYMGDITLRNGIVQSINCATVDLMDRVRPVYALHYARMMGISSPMPPTLSSALGSGDVIPMELASAYCVFANQGIKTRPYCIVRIEDYSGNTIRENFPEEKQVISPQTNYIMLNLMQQVCEYGTGWYTRRLKRPHAGKTGTTNDFSDAWFTGYVPDLVTTVWVGYDDHTPLGKKKAGGVVAAPIWTRYMIEALANTPVLDFPVPSGIVFVNFDTDTGMLATGQSEKPVLQPFKKGTEPKEYF